MSSDSGVVHHLPTRSDYFQAVLDGRKTFEIREIRNRQFVVGDILRLEEEDSDIGRWMMRRVIYVLTHNQYNGVAPGYCVMGLGPVI